MTDNLENKPRSRDERAQAQRARILDAAQRCFIRDGFHAASMANISAMADMSPGLIYRYFDNKDAIILAIIEQQLAEKRSNIAQLASAAQLAQAVRDLFDGWRRRDESVMNAALFLEMSAQATRDPKISQALAQADRITGADFRNWLRQRAQADGVEANAQEIEVRSLVLQSFVEGLAIRAVREPDYNVDTVVAAVGRLLPRLLSFAP